ncbi:MAG: membrane protein insertion efficiency factor YidD [Cohaesibacteraceae bacterium]
MAWLLRGFIRFYQLTFSSIFGRTCRHIPTCSAYADEASARYGAWPGVWMALARFWRCRPFGSSGLDPVPERLNPDARWYTPWRYGHWTGAHIPESHRLSD